MKGGRALHVAVWSLLLLITMGQAAAAQQDGPIVLRVATHINDPELVEPQIEIMRRFEDLHPGVKIEVWYTDSNNYQDQLLAQYLGGIGPDVATILRPYFASYIAAGLIQPLDRFIEADPDFSLDSVIPSLMYSGMYKGSVYGFPVYNGPAQLFYNQDAFIDRGVAEPPEYIAQNAWDWDTFVEVAKKMTYDTNGDGRPDVCGYDGYATWDAGWVPFIRAAGGDIIGLDGRSWLNRPESIQGLEFLNNLNVVHQVTRNPGHGGCSYAVGGTAMRIRWQTTAFIEKNLIQAFNLEVALNPAGPAGYAHLAGGVPVTVSRHTQHPEIAYEFAKWLATESGLWKVRGGPPLTFAELRSEEYRSTLQLFENWILFERAIIEGDPRPEPQFGVVEHDAMNRILYDVMITPVINGQVAVRTAMEEAHRLLSDLLEAETAREGG
ncbi:MAG: sugar ABC transporter substrate-binding protein [Firmicutes bacterium]|nr:sugar ABC transporter substrate-binding protein [Bacillota bacterium]